jgi:uncharacterized protein YecE (DUF72 family)
VNRTGVLVGTAGWSYPDWEGAVYPLGADATDRLRTVAEYLGCVEVDSSFYRPPAASVTANWVKRTADRPQFRFLAKAWQRFTHQRDRAWLPAEFAVFSDGLQPLRESGRLEALLFQFPWSFRNEPASRDWLARISDGFAGWPVAVELRHDSWDDPAVRDWLHQRQIIYVNIDQPLLNRCLGPSAYATSGVGYFRLHGRNTQNWFRDPQEQSSGRYDYLYSGPELDQLWVPIQALAAQTRQSFVIFNNHNHGKAFANALQLCSLRDGTPAPTPALVLERFPALRGQVRAVGQEQTELGLY